MRHVYDNLQEAVARNFLEFFSLQRYFHNKGLCDGAARKELDSMLSSTARSQEKSPALAQSQEESPALAKSQEKSPAVAQSQEESPVLAQSQEESPHGGNR